MMFSSKLLKGTVRALALSTGSVALPYYCNWGTFLLKLKVLSFVSKLEGIPCPPQGPPSFFLTFFLLVFLLSAYIYVGINLSVTQSSG